MDKNKNCFFQVRNFSSDAENVPDFNTVTLSSSSSSSIPAASSLGQGGELEDGELEANMLVSLGATVLNQEDVEQNVINQFESRINQQLLLEKEKNTIKYDSLSDILSRSDVENSLEEKLAEKGIDVDKSKKHVLQRFLEQTQKKIKFLPRESAGGQATSHDVYSIKIQLLVNMIENSMAKEMKEKEIKNNNLLHQTMSVKSLDSYANAKRNEGETIETAIQRRERLIRTGVITPFHFDTPENEKAFETNDQKKGKRQSDNLIYNAWLSSIEHSALKAKSKQKNKKKNTDPFKRSSKLNVGKKTVENMKEVGMNDLEKNKGKGKKKKEPRNSKTDKVSSSMQESRLRIRIGKELIPNSSLNVPQAKTSQLIEDTAINKTKRKAHYRNHNDDKKKQKIDDNAYLPENMSKCPICARLFRLDKIEVHVDKCLTRPRTFDHSGGNGSMDEINDLVDLTGDFSNDEEQVSDIPNAGRVKQAGIIDSKTENKEVGNDGGEYDKENELQKSSDNSSSDDEKESNYKKKQTRDKKTNNGKRKGNSRFAIHDDSNPFIFRSRVRKYIKQQKRFRKKLREMLNLEVEEEIAAKQIIHDENELEEHTTTQVGELEEYPSESDDSENDEDDDNQLLRSETEMIAVDESNDFRIPKMLYYTLFPYQRTGIRWLWELHRQGTGGILGDEQGLGKTCQICSFLAGLKCSGILRPSIIVCPATTLSLWVSQLNRWYAPLRVWVLHSSGAGKTLRGMSGSEIILKCMRNGDVILTTYQGLRMYRDDFLGLSWGYAILDEGHKLKNPDADITMVCKQLRTVHRIVISGTPIQNNLKELWSLFDFVYPGRLGTLPMFESQFSVPINAGGYANASNIQVQMAYRCAMVLKESISPYLLRRLKKDVATQLPKKTEQVLFCNLTDEQREIYREFLSKPEIEEVINRSRYSRFKDTTRARSFGLIKSLQHICNHPDLYHNKQLLQDDSKAIKKAKARILAIGNLETLVKRSGKLLVLRTVMRKWLEQKHRVLLFSQSRLMLDILETFCDGESFNYLRMDGTTSIKTRGHIIDKFNHDKNVFVFLLTTKVGGVGINLIGADRVVLYDPDWNPSTDSQARERAWRLGQKNQVTIYRLITNGTIEEKIYHRQIFKQYLTNKVLTDPRQRKFFNYSSLKDLFTLGDTGEHDNNIRSSMKGGPKAKKSTETSELFESATIRQEEYKNDEQDGNKDNTNVLETLFTGGDDATKRVFRQAFSHDHVEGAAHNDPDQRILHAEANRVAQEAAEALLREQQRTQRSADQVHVPTWTGRSGDFGRRFGGEGSASLLNRMRQRQAGTFLPINSNNNSRLETEGANNGSPEEILKDLKRFLIEGPKSTESILMRFSNTGMDPSVFRELLRKIAKCIDGSWFLRSKYR